MAAGANREVRGSEGIKMHYHIEEEDQTDKKAILSLKLLFDSRNYKIG